MDSPDPPASDGRAVAAGPGSRWYQRVLPVSGLAVLLVGLAVLVVPAFRQQVELSTSRRAQPYVELYFARAATAKGQAVCLAKGSKALVRFVVESHLEGRQQLAYRVSLSPSVPGARAVLRAGSVRTSPGGSAEVVTRFTRPRGGYLVSVRLPALDQQLRAHCPGRP